MADAKMTWSATEQPLVAMESRLTAPARPALLTPMKWEIHVDFNNGMWWAMPHELSDAILEEWYSGANRVSYVWDWQHTRKGSYRPNGADTSINRYILDFETMQQRNIDNGCTRKIQVACVIR